MTGVKLTFLDWLPRELTVVQFAHSCYPDRRTATWHWYIASGCRRASSFVYWFMKPMIHILVHVYIYILNPCFIKPYIGLLYIYMVYINITVYWFMKPDHQSPITNHILQWDLLIKFEFQTVSIASYRYDYQTLVVCNRVEKSLVVCMERM